MAQFNTTELDFNEIKENLKDYFRRNEGPFKDFDFDGAGLSYLLDILAYNTHYNAVNAHMAMNESFLDSAQVRGNVVSRAKLLGYTPKSVTAPKALLNVTFTKTTNTASNYYNEGALVIPRNTVFNSIIDDINYSFVTTKVAKADLNRTRGTFTFNNLEVAQGTVRTETYIVDNSYDQRFILNSSKIDTSSIQVEVFPNPRENVSETYVRFTEFPLVDGESLIYFIDENSDGNFEIRFGNNLFGKRPQATAEVRITYLVSEGDITNGATAFSYKLGQLDDESLRIEQGDVAVRTASKAAGGAPAEDINSIKYNAPLSFIAQERAVTADDYKSLIMKNFSGIDNVTAWGGETQANPEFGKVLVSIKPTAAEFLTAAQKQEILSYLQGKKVVGLIPEIVDPEYTYIYYELFFKYDPSATTQSGAGLEASVRTTLNNYNRTRLNNFDGVYRHSNLLTAVDLSDPAILSTVARVYCYKNVNITTSTADTHIAEFDFLVDGSVDQKESMISSSSFLVNGVRATLADRPIQNESTKREIYAIRSVDTGSGVEITPNVGTLFINTGRVELNNLVHDNNETIEIRLRPASDDVISKERKILQIDVDKTLINGQADSVAISGSSGNNTYTTFTRDA